MITVSKKWIRLIGIVGCTVWMASCKQASDAGVKSSSYAVMQIEAVDKEFSSSYSASIRGRQDIDIYPQVSGTIEKLCVTEGQKSTPRAIAFHYRPSALQGRTENRHCQCGSSTCRAGYCRTDLQKQQRTVCAESSFGIQSENGREFLSHRQSSTVAGRSPRRSVPATISLIPK